MASIITIIICTIVSIIANFIGMLLVATYAVGDKAGLEEIYKEVENKSIRRALEKGKRKK